MENTVNDALHVAQGISEYGIMTMISSVFILFACALMVACFRWFKTVIERIIGEFSKQLEEISTMVARNNEAMIDISEGLLPETQLRVKNMSGVFFDLSVEKVCRLIKKIREENHITNKDATKAKIRTLLHNLHEDRNSRFDCFRYRGKKLSYYSNPEWIEWVAKVIEGELYNETGANNGRAHTNVVAVYDNIKIDFYHRLNS